MLTRRAKAYSSSCSRVISIFSFILSQFTVLQPTYCKKSLTAPILEVQVYSVIDVYTTKKEVTSACYDKQHVCQRYDFVTKKLKSLWQSTVKIWQNVTDGKILLLAAT